MVEKTVSLKRNKIKLKKIRLLMFRTECITFFTFFALFVIGFLEVYPFPNEAANEDKL